VARPSWNTLAVRTSAPVQAAHGPGGVTGLAVQGAATGISAGDVILLSAGSAGPAPVTVQGVGVDLAAKVTTVTLQGQAAVAAVPAVAGPAVTEPAVPGGAGVVHQANGVTGADRPSAADGPPGTVVGAMDLLTGELGKRPAPPPPSAAALNRGPGQVFAPRSDAVTRIVAALDPVVAGTLYPAIGTATIGSAAITGAMALQVRATPFGVQMPPRPVFNARGQQTGTQEWPIAGLQTLSGSLLWSGGRPSGTAEVTFTGPDGNQIQAPMDLAAPAGPGTGPSVQLAGLGTVQLSQGPAPALGQLTFTPSPPSTGLSPMTVTLGSPDDTGTYPVTFGDGSTFGWRPVPGQALSFTVGAQRVSIEWARPPNTDRKFTEALLTVSVAEALPVAGPTVLDLDTTYPGIVPGSWVVIENPGATASTISYPLACQVTAAATVTVTRYGMSGTVTELTLDRSWIDGSARWLSALRPMTVRGKSAALTLLPVPLPGPLSGGTIDLDGLHAGLEAGRRILVTGIRADLPAGATVPAGEQAMIAGVTQNAAGGAGTAYTTLHLAAPLAYSYGLGSVQIYGNVVPARQGATVTEPLSGAAPGDPHPSFTLSQAPVLADPSATAAGSVSSLKLTVGDRTWHPVPRLGASTAAGSYQTGTDSQGKTTITLSGPLPTGTSSVVASYRTGFGGSGNVRAGQVTQLLSRPLTVAGVTNPLPGSGGSGGDGPGDLRARAPVGLASLGRLVSVSDAADLVLSWAGVGKAHAVQRSLHGAEIVAVTVAGVAPAALIAGDELLTDLAGALAAAGRPEAPVLVVPAPLYLIVLAARVRCAVDFDWAGVAAALRAALTGAFGYGQRGLGQGIVVSEIVAVAHTVAGVESFAVTGLTLIPSAATPSDISEQTANLPAPPASGRVPLPTAAVDPHAATPPGEAVAYLSGAVSDTLILQRVVH
jgi:predicted phage baseplate assembly protein